MDYIPNFSLDAQNVYLRKNSCFYMHDFSLWPQWYFEATKHFPFIQRRLSADELATHDLHMLWYDMTDADFVCEPGSVANIGRLRPDLVKVFLEMRIDLSKKIDDLIPRLGGHPDDFRYAQHSMLIMSIVLEVGLQTVRGTPYASDDHPSSASASDSRLPSAPATSSLFRNAFGRMTSYATRSRPASAPDHMMLRDVA